MESCSHQAHNLVYGCGFVFRGFPSKFWVQTPTYFLFLLDNRMMKTSPSHHLSYDELVPCEV
ncbi:hypothetical protein HanRHA438_Chr01g0025221 [Helianthus annuus]|nr:hypothetical protein HanRHA438_Chr01g0025221 [Helianthus annuus]